MQRLYRGLTSAPFAAALILVALIGVLLANLDGLASTLALARPDASRTVHMGTALAIEVGVVGATLQAAAMARRGMDGLWPGIVLAVVVLVSTVANMSDALAGVLGTDASWAAIQAADPWRLVMAGSMGGVLPFLVLALSKTIEQGAQADGEPATMPTRSAWQDYADAIEERNRKSPFGRSGERES